MSTHRPQRRDALRMLAACALAPIASHAGAASEPILPCGDHGAPFNAGGAGGWFGRLAPRGSPLTMEVIRRTPSARQPWRYAYLVRHEGRRYLNPTLVLKPRERVRIDLVNHLDEATIAHWHGLANDSRNDGAGFDVVAPGQRFRYDFEVVNRGGLYWYHPHPHGATARQAYLGLFGLVEVEDADERALRSALDLVPGVTELPIVLQDRRAGYDYPATPADAMHGLIGDRVLVSGVHCPALDVSTRLYRLRILNASNARTYRLGLRRASGARLPWTLVGVDGGLLDSPRRCEDLFLAGAERIDMLADFSSLDVGERVVLETRAFDPMHLETDAGTGTAATDHSAMQHEAAPSSGSTSPPPAAGAAPHDAHAGHAMADAAHATMEPSMPMDHSMHGGAFPEGAARVLAVFRVARRLAYARAVPARLSTLPPTVEPARERAFRLGFAKGRWRINDRVFVMDESPIEVSRGAAEMWLIRNYHTSMPHAMHLHGFSFRVEARETSPDAIAALAVDDRGRLATDLGVKDTVLVWPGESVRARVDFAMPYEGSQRYVFHCHNLEHEDAGMMLGMTVA